MTECPQEPSADANSHDAAMGSSAAGEPVLFWAMAGGADAYPRLQVVALSPGVPLPPDLVLAGPLAKHVLPNGALRPAERAAGQRLPSVAERNAPLCAAFSLKASISTSPSTE